MQHSNGSACDDAQLIAQARQGDQQAWAAVVRRYQQPAFRLAYLYLRDSADAEDVAQEAFVRVYRSLSSYDTARPFKPWLLQIVVNLARNRQRSLSRYWAALQQWRNQQPVAEQSVVEQRLAAEQLWQAAGSLKRSWRDVIYLRYFLELSVGETAQVLGVAEGTVKSRTSRALTQLKRIVERDYPELAL